MCSKKLARALPEELRYSSSHEWIRILKEDIAIIGVTDYAFEDEKKLDITPFYSLNCLM